MRRFKNLFFIIIAVLSFGIMVGYSALNTSFTMEGSTTVGISLEDLDYYIGNLFVNGVNKFNSISMKDNSFKFTADSAITTVKYYVANNSTQYTVSPTVTCIVVDSDGNEVSDPPISSFKNTLSSTIQPQSVAEGSITLSKSTDEDVYYVCSATFDANGMTSKKTATKTIFFAGDGLTFATSNAYKTYSSSSTTYGKLFTPTVEDGTFNYWRNTDGVEITSSLLISDRNDEVLYANYSIDLCNYDYNQIVYTREAYGADKFTALCEGTYLIEVSGAQGGTAKIGSYQSRGGYGGTSSITIDLAENTDLYLYVGGMPKITTADATTPDFNNEMTGGANGGGSGVSAFIDQYHLVAGAPGGGATHVALSLGSGNSYELSSYNTSSLQSQVLVVAGGGGGGIVYYENPFQTQLNGTVTPYYYYYNNIGGYGGGTRGNTGTVNDSRTSCSLTGDSEYSSVGELTGGDGGAPSSGGSGDNAGSFGQGGNGYSGSTITTAGGGGGWYGGGSGVGYTGAAGGGSGYYSKTKTVSGETSGNKNLGDGSISIMYIN